MDSDEHCQLVHVSITTKLLASRRENKEGISREVFCALWLQEQNSVRIKKEENCDLFQGSSSPLRRIQNKGIMLAHGRADPGRQVAVATRFCTVQPNICGYSKWNMLCGTLLTPTVLRWSIYFWKIYASQPMNRRLFKPKTSKTKVKNVSATASLSNPQAIKL